MKSINKELVSFLPQPSWLPYTSHREVVGAFPQCERICKASQGPDQFWNVSALSATPLFRLLPTQKSAQLQASQMFYDMYGGYSHPFYPSPGRLAAVDVAIAVDAAPLGTPSEFVSGAFASRLVGSSLFGSLFAGLDATVSTSALPAEAIPATTQPDDTLYNLNNTWSKPSLAALLLTYLIPTFVKPDFYLSIALFLHAFLVAVLPEPLANIFFATQPSLCSRPPLNNQLFRFCVIV